MAVHELIQRAGISLVSFEGMRIVSPELFWPYSYSDIPPTTTPFWPNLRRTQISRGLRALDGDWYLMPDSSPIPRGAELVDGSFKLPVHPKYGSVLDIPERDPLGSTPNPKKIESPSGQYCTMCPFCAITAAAGPMFYSCELAPSHVSLLRDGTNL